MGQLTRGQIVTNGLLIAGKPSLTSLANIWLNAWLKSTYEAWPWPWLLKQQIGISLSAGASSLTIGAGNGGVTDAIQDIFDPIFVYTSDLRAKGEARVRQLMGGPVEKETYTLVAADTTGIPKEFKSRESSTAEGVYTLTPYPFPDVAYLLSINYKLLVPALSSDSDTPRYPNDRTLMQAVVVAAWQYMADERYAEGVNLLHSLVNEDKMKAGERTGSNDLLGLDQGVFRRAQ